MDTHEPIEDFAARTLGMKRREIIDVTRIAAGLVVTTHDNQRTLVTPQGVSSWRGELPVAPLVDERSGVQEEAPIRFDLAAVPDGSTAEVLEWVKDDPDRARRALEVEADKEKPRTGLVAQLERLVRQ